MLIPSTITARRTRRYTSTWYIHPTTHKHDFEPMDGTGRYIFQPPQCQAVNPSRWSTLPPPFTPHRELSPGPAVAHPPHRLTQEVGGATGGVGPALAQPGHQHLAGAGGNGQQRVIAAGAGIAVVARSLLGQSIGLADGRVQVDGQGRVAGSGPSGPGPANNWRLTRSS